MLSPQTDTDGTRQRSQAFSSDQARWEAVQRRDAGADGVFFYSVRTTGVYCRPSCAARLPRRENVGFHTTPADAERGGFRPCKRCRPNVTAPDLATPDLAASGAAPAAPSIIARIAALDWARIAADLDACGCATTGAVLTPAECDVLAASYQSNVGRAASGALAALAGLTKFAPLALAPLLATHGVRGLPRSRRAPALALFGAAFLGTAALASIVALSHDSLHTIYERTIAYQSNRGSPFSVGGLYGGLGAVQQTVQIAAVALALLLAALPRRPDLVGLAAACAAVVVATQLGIDHWFYLYIPWFFPLAMLALLGRFSDPRSPPAVAALEPARLSRPAAAASSG